MTAWREYGRYGYRKIAGLLEQAGWIVNDKRVERIWRRERLKVLQGLMDAYEIVVHEIDCHHVVMVRGFLRKGIREPRHVAVAHSDVQILSLRIIGRNVFGIGTALRRDV